MRIENIQLWNMTKRNKEVMVFISILIVVIMIFMWIKIYPTIEEPLIEYPDKITIQMVNKYQNTDMVSSWGVGDNKIEDDLQQQISSVLSKGLTHRVFLADTYTRQMFGTMYRIELYDGKKHKSIWLGGDYSYVLIGEKTYRYVNNPEVIIAELDALLTAT